MHTLQPEGRAKRVTVTRKDAERVFKAICKQFGGWLEEPGTAAHARAIDPDDYRYGPFIKEDFDWNHGDPIPFAIVWEGGPYQWPIYVPYGGIEEEFGFRIKSVEADIPKHIFLEAVTSWSIGLYVL